MAFDVEGAREAGYSDEDIAKFLGRTHDFDVRGAAKAGYSYADIVGHLSKRDAKPTIPAAAPTPATTTTEVAPDDNSSDFLRGLGNIPGQMQETFGAAQALTGVATGSKSMAKSGLETMEAGKQRQTTKETDSFSNAWEKGIWTVATDWLPYQMGAGVGTMAETLAFMGVGGVGGGATTGGVGAVPGAVAGFVSKQLIKSGIKEAAEELVKKETKKLIAEGATKEAAKLAATQIGREFAEAEAKKVLTSVTTQAAKQYAKEGGKKVGLGTMASMHGLGEVGGRAFEEAEKRGESPEDISLARALPAAAVHAVADYAAEKIGLGALKMSDKSLNNFIGDVLKHIAVYGSKEVPAELVQTIAERFGAQLNLADAEALKEYADTIAASYGMMVGPGTIGGVKTNFAGKVERRLAESKARLDDYEKAKLESTSATDEGYKLAPSEAQADAELVAMMQPGVDESGNAFAKTSAGTTAAAKTVQEQKDMVTANAQGLVAKFDGGQTKFAKGEISAAAKALGVKFDFDTDKTNEAKINKIREHLAQQGGPSANGPQQPAAGTSTSVAAQPATPAGQSAGAVNAGTPSTATTAGPAPAGETAKPAALTKPASQMSTDELVADAAEARARAQKTSKQAQEQTKQTEAAPAAPAITPDIQVRRETIAGMVKKGQTGGSAFKKSLATLNQLEKAAGLPLTTAGGTLKEEGDTTLSAAMRMMQEQEKSEQENFDTAVDEAINWRSKEGQPDWQYEISEGDRQLYEETRKEENERNNAARAQRTQAIDARDAAKKRLREIHQQMDELAEDAPEDEIHRLDALEQKAIDEVDKLDRAIEAIGTVPHNLPEWDKLEPHMKDVYFGNITSGTRDEKGKLTFGSSKREHRTAAKALQKHRASIGGREKEKRSTEEERIVLHYEEERAEASKREGVSFPPWNQLTKEQRDVYLQEVINNAGILQRVGFSELAKKLTEDNKELTPEQKQVILANIEFRKQQQEEFARNAEELKDLQRQNQKKTATKTRLPDNVVKMLQEGNLQGVLQHLRTLPDNKLPFRRIMKATAQALFEMKLNTKIEMVSSLDGALAMYDPFTDTIYVTEAGLSESTILHEIVHAGTVKVLNTFLNGNKRSLTAEQIAACEQLQTIMDETRSELIERYPFAYKSLFEFVSYAMTNEQMQEDLHDLSAEYHLAGKSANALYNLFQQKAGPVPANRKFSENIQTILPKEKSQWSTFKLAIVGILKVAKVYFRNNKLRPDVQANFPIEIMGAFDTILAVPEGGIVLPKDEKLEANPPQGGTAQPRTRGAHRGQDDPGFKVRWKEMPHHLVETVKKLGTREGWVRMAHTFSDNRVYIRNWQRTRDLAGLIYREGKDKINNVYDQIIMASSDARNFYRVYLSEAADDLDRAIGDFARAENMTTERALAELQKILECIHEPERRIVKYLLTVPLSTKENITHNGKKVSAADRRDAIIKILDSKTLSKDQAEQLRYELDSIVFERDAKGDLVLDSYGYPKPNLKYVDPIGKSPTTKTTTDPKTGQTSTIKQIIDITDDQKYNATGVDKDDAKKIRNDLSTDKHLAEINAVRESLQKLHEGTTSLNKLANYWSRPVSNRVAFYGWKDYIPLKGRPGQKAEEDEQLSFDTFANRFGKHGKELQDAEGAFGGRFSESNNAILQSMVDASRSSLRAGRRNLTLALKNAVTNKDANGRKLMEGKVKKTIEFADRNNVDLSDLKGRRVVFHYNENGSIDIIEVADDKLLESVSRTYKDLNHWIEFMNKWTSRLGQMHTRYNYQFGIKNFVVDVLTNAWNITASELGPVGGAAYIKDVAQNVMNGGMYKAAQVVALFQKGDERSVRALNEMARKDPYVRDMIEYMKRGMVTHLHGMSLQSNFEELNKEVGRSGVLRNVEQMNQFLDIWGNMFEVASRASAYSVAKNRFMKNQNMTEESAKTKAIVFAKNLANFEQIGELGRGMSAWYMFTRPSAVSAHRAIEALVPAFTSMEHVETHMPPEIADNPQAKAQYLENYKKLQFNSRVALSASIGLGMLAYTMAYMMADDDDDLGRNPVATDNMDLWTRYARFHIPRRLTETMGIKEPVVFQIPWGFGIGSLSAIGPQFMAVGMGTNKLSNAAANVATSVLLDSFLPIPVSRINPFESFRNAGMFFLDTIAPSTVRPILEAALNTNGLGQDIVSASQRRLGAAYTAGDNIPEIWKDVAEWMHDSTDGFFDLSPNQLYFLTNSYIDGVGRLAETAYNLADIGQGRKDFSPKQDMILFGSFFGVRSSYEAREFNSVQQQIEKKQKILNDYKLKPEKYADYVSRHPFDEALVDFYYKAKAKELDPLRAEDNRIRNDKSMNPNDRRDLLRLNAVQEAIVKRNMIEAFKAYDIKP